MGTWTTSDAGGQGGGTYTTWTDIDVARDGVESTLGDEAHTSGQVPPMRAQQAHVKVTSPAKAHSVSTSTIAKQCGRLPIESVRLSISSSGTRASEVLQEETAYLLQIFPSCDCNHDTVRMSTAQGSHRPQSSHGGGEGRDRHGRVTCRCTKRVGMQARSIVCPPSRLPPAAHVAWQGVRSTLSQRGCPTPAARRVASSIPRPAQHAASVPFITTAGTLRIPKLCARRATSGLCISKTVTSHEGHAIWLTSVTVSSQAGHPALKISIVRFAAIVVPFQLCTSSSVASAARMGQSVISPCPEHASMSFASAYFMALSVRIFSSMVVILSNAR